MSKHIRNTRVTTVPSDWQHYLLGMVGPPSASASETQSAVSSSLNKVTIAGDSYFEIKQIHLLPSQSGNLATFTVTLHNEGSSELKFAELPGTGKKQVSHSVLSTFIASRLG